MVVFGVGAVAVATKFLLGRDGYTCEGTYPPAGGRCIPVCSSDSQCGDGAVCQRDTGRCVPSGTPVPMGAAVGAACMTNSDCRSNLCTPETIRGNPTAFAA